MLLYCLYVNARYTVLYWKIYFSNFSIIISYPILLQCFLKASRLELLSNVYKSTFILLLSLSYSVRVKLNVC